MCPGDLAQPVYHCHNDKAKSDGDAHMGYGSAGLLIDDNCPGAAKYQGESSYYFGNGFS